MISSIVVDYLETNFPKGSNVGIAYLYCDYDKRHDQTLEHFLASLSKQLLQKRSSIPDVVKQLHSRHNDKLTRPSYEELSEALQDVTAIYTRAFIIVDALDECTAGKCRTTLLSKIFELQAKLGINIFATSRIKGEVTKLFDGALCLTIRANDEDLKTYLNGRMIHEQPDIFSGDIQEMAVSEMIKAADGLYVTHSTNT
jgi:hypothetical protein